MTGFAGFVIGAALLLGATLLLLLWPLLWPLLRRAPRSASAARDQAASDATIIAGFRTQLADLQVERDRGTLAAEAFEQSRRELEQRLLGELGRAAESRAQSAGGAGGGDGAGAGDRSGAPRWSAWTWVGACGAVIVLPLLLYAQFGVLDGLRPVMADQGAAAAAAGQGDGGGRAGEITPAQVEAMIGKLEEHLKNAPQDAEGWTMLGRAYNFLQRFELASAAYAKAIALRPDDSQLLADAADALAMANGRTLAGAPMELIGRALKIDPANPKALALAGTNAFDQRDYAAAIGFWERAAKVAGQDPEFVAALNNSVAEARARAGGRPAAAGGAAAAPAVQTAAGAAPSAASGATAPPGGASVSGRVTLAPAIAARAGPDDTVFVFARAEQGPRIPLALMRRQVKDLPIEFALDESMAMMPQMSLAKFPTVVVGARISKSGTAAPSSGDLQGFSTPVKVGTSGVRVEISEVVP